MRMRGAGEVSRKRSEAAGADRSAAVEIDGLEIEAVFGGANSLLTR